MQFIKNSIFTELGWKLHILPFRLVFLVFLDQGCSKVWKSMEKGFGWSDNVVGIVWLISLVGLQNFLGGGRGNQNPLPPGSYSPAHYATYVRVIARGGRGYRGPEPPRTLADYLTLFKLWGANYARHTTPSPPGWKMLSTPLYILQQACFLSRVEVEWDEHCRKRLQRFLSLKMLVLLTQHLSHISKIPSKNDKPSFFINPWNVIWLLQTTPIEW